MAIFPYDEDFDPIDQTAERRVLQHLWFGRTNLANNKLFGGQTKTQAGLRWYEYGRLTSDKLRTPLSITFAFVATHNHFVLDRGASRINRRPRSSSSSGTTNRAPGRVAWPPSWCRSRARWTISRWPTSPCTTPSLAPRVVKYGSDVPPEIVGLVQTGSPARALPPCDSCHGVTMSGPAESPVLLGQSVTYFEQQMNAFAAGQRRNDTYGRMRIIARALTPEEIRQLAAYYGPRPGRERAAVSD